MIILSRKEVIFIMKIQFIGTGTIPDIANSASVLINEHILFDIPNGNLKAMIRQNIDILKIDTLIISHTHADHCFDLPFLLWYKKNYQKGNEELSTKIVTDKITQNTVETLINLSHFNSARNAKKEFIDAEEVNSIENICDDVQISNVPIEHESFIIKYANGYIIKDKNISIGLTGDSTFCQGVKILASKVDYLISDMTLEVDDESHMGINNVLELLKEHPNLRIIPIHMHDETREKALKLNIDNLIILNDGDILEI